MLCFVVLKFQTFLVLKNFCFHYALNSGVIATKILQNIIFETFPGFSIKHLHENNFSTIPESLNRFQKPVLWFCKKNAVLVSAESQRLLYWI